MKELGPFIKSAREQKKITIREAEELSGISNAYLSQIENGKVKKPSPDILLKISRLYMVPYEMLLMKADYPIPDYGINQEKNEHSSAVVLIVDDSFNERELIRSYLENDPENRYVIFEAESGEKALEAIAKRKPDCILLDYRLSDMDGLEVFAKLKKMEEMKSTSVIIMTGQGNEETAVQAMRMGAVNYLTKGNFSDETMKLTVQHAIRRKKLLQSISSTARYNREYRGEMQALLFDIATQINGAVEEIMARKTELHSDTDLVLILEKTREIMELVENSEKPIRKL